MDEKKINSLLFDSLLRGYEIRYSDLIQYIIETNKNYIPFSNMEVTDVKVHRERKYTDIWIEGKKKGEKVSFPLVIMKNKLKSVPIQNQLEGYTEKILKEFVNFYKKLLRTEKGKSKIYSEDIFNDNTLLNELHNIEFIILSPLGDEKFDIEVSHPLMSELKDKLTKLYEKQNKQSNNGANSKINNKIELLQNANANEKIRISWKPKSYADFGKDIYEKVISNYSNILILEGSGVEEIKKRRQQIYQEELIADFSSLLVNFESLFEILNNDVQKLTIGDTYETNRKFNELDLSVLYKKYRASQCAKLLFTTYNNRFGLHPAVYGDWKMEEIENGAIIVKHDYTSLGKNGLFEIFRKIDNVTAIDIQCEKNVLKKGIVFRYDKNSDCDVYIGQQYKTWYNDTWKGNHFMIKSKADGDPPTKYHTYKIAAPFKFYYSKLDLPPDTAVSEIVDFMIDRVLAV